MPQCSRKHIQRQSLEAQSNGNEPSAYSTAMPGPLKSYWKWAVTLAAKVCCTTGLMCPEQYKHDSDTVTQTSLIYSRIALDLRRDSQTPTSLTEFPVPAHHCSKKVSFRPRCQGNRSKSKDFTYFLLYRPWRFEFPLKRMSKSKIIPNTYHIEKEETYYLQPKHYLL